MIAIPCCNRLHDALMIAALSEENMANSLTADLFAATVALACSTVAAPAADYDVGSIHIAQPWSRATPKGAKAGAGYMTITNKGNNTRQSQLRFR